MDTIEIQELIGRKIIEDIGLIKLEDNPKSLTEKVKDVIVEIKNRTTGCWTKYTGHKINYKI